MFGETFLHRLTTFRIRPAGASWIILFLSLIGTLMLSNIGKPPPTMAAVTGNGRIYFASDRTGDWEIFSINSSGGNPVNVTDSPSTKDERPGASPDGSKIAFGRTTGQNTDIYVMNVNGTGLKRLTTAPENDHAPQWSPDGTKIAFRSDRDGNGEIYVMNADGSNQTRLTNNPAREHGPDWSPDGTRIIFSSDRSGNDDIYVMNADGSDVKQLTTNPADDFGASWSPDGERVVFRSDRNGAPEVYIMNIDGSGQTNLTNNDGWDRGPAWSPDGNKVIFYSDRDGDYEIYVMNPDGTNQTRLTFTKGRDFQPDWASDGVVVEPDCYALTLTHTGQGANPAATPAKSAGCDAGQYVAGATISLTAAPDAGWAVAGWNGTSNDAATTTTNSLTMPDAAHTAGVTYSAIPVVCHVLTLTHTGQGANPAATPAKSAGCDAGQYVTGATISLTAVPDAGWAVAGWNGTSNDAATTTTNSLTMPDAAHTAGVTYSAIPVACHVLTLTHTGQGANPVATPAFSSGCGTGSYTVGQSISLTAVPDAGWAVAGWNGTNNDAATTTTNSLVMPGAAHTAGVTYVETPAVCYALTLTHTGQGANPVASPAKSSGCGAGQYVAGEAISLTAAPDAGWAVAGWNGTNNDAATTTTNSIIMPATNHVAGVIYAEVVVEECPFTLMLNHTGNGADPVPVPSHSAGCNEGYYRAGESISLTAAPAAGWRVSGWSGTNDDAGTSTTNTVIMPAAAHVVSVAYEVIPAGATFWAFIPSVFNQP